ncbi:MAG TPA: anti-sigma-D factor RsdA [Actinophytocola sp.]|uniref:anti-sigma-D factor RsdA n=1 Tax=Actinophytocola sp. TaxID=1872138 RepID=UPI002DB59502|nr:anti-sigma-D factor RsdA [Actinophytocola sp.]HEU5475984.1 anti-sigma-D factor RsdA [Actinophytocola sp.]
MADLPEREPASDIESLLRTAGVVDQPDLDDAIDFSLVHADDEFLDALGGGQPDPDGRFADDRLAALLLSWRQDVDAEPIANLVEPKLAVATVQAARTRQRRGPRLIAPLAAAAAVLAIAFAGIGLAARGAEPGDTLWGLARVLYSDHARSVEAAQAVRSDLSKAEKALENGQVAEAKSMLDEARVNLPTVSTEDGQADLKAQHDALVAKLPGNPADEAVPPPAASPVPNPGSGISSSTTTTTAPTTTSPTTTSPTTTTTTPTTTTSDPGRIETETSSPDAPKIDPNGDSGRGAEHPQTENEADPDPDPVPFTGTAP